uniref:Uncharacterized protein n=1 Tax=Onchocerca volvulus TaxID=6282 RepID=A0A8R1XZK4_ONCVO
MSVPIKYFHQFRKNRRDRFDLSGGYLVHQQHPTAQQRPLTSYPHNSAENEPTLI